MVRLTRAPADSSPQDRHKDLRCAIASHTNPVRIIVEALAVDSQGLYGYPGHCGSS